MSGNNDYLGYCRHGICVYWSESKFRPSTNDYRSVHEMRRGSVEQARKELNKCIDCESARNQPVANGEKK